MTNREQAKMTGLDGIDSYMSQTAVDTILSANVPFTTERTGFSSAYVDAKNKASATGTDNSGFSIAKENAKIAMSNLIAQFAGYAFTKWDEDNLNKPELQKKMHIHPSYYMDLSDALAASEAQGVRNVMNDNLTPDLVGYVAAADIASIDAAILKFVNTQGSSNATHAGSEVETAAFKTALHKAVRKMRKLPIMARFLIGSPNEEIYNKIVTLSELPPSAIRHTDIILQLFNQQKGHPVINATIVYSKSTKLFVADLQGVYHCEHVHFGQGLITVDAPGYLHAEMIVNVERGRQNHFEIQLVPSGPATA